MDERQTPFLCGGVLFFLLTEAAFDGPAPRERYKDVKDDHANPILMSDLIYAFSGSGNYYCEKDTSNYKECKFEGGVNIPFNQVRLCAGYDQEVRGRYSTALSRMDEFVSWHFDPGAKDWFVKAVLEIIENDGSIQDDMQLFIRQDGTAMSKDDIRKETDYDLSAFLVGVLHFITNQRRGQNGLGVPTLESFTEKKSRKPRRYTGNLGEAIIRTVNVAFLPSRNKEVEETLEGSKTILEPDAILDREDALVKGISSIAAAFESQKHAMVEQIRHNNRRKESASNAETAGTDEWQSDRATHEDTKTTVIQQKTNVIQNGDNNYNVTNNGTINFNF